MIVELHMLQSFGPSCLNRDDTNSPKDCEFGGCRRARISSQCLKRAIRWHPEFVEALDGVFGLRTKRLAEKLAKELTAVGKEPVAAGDIAAALVQALFGQLGPDRRTRALSYLGSDECERLRYLILEHWETLHAAQVQPPIAPAALVEGRSLRRRDPLQEAARAIATQFMPGTRAADIALFGRMVAENAHLNLDAACQVAHAISTHRVTMEMDFFTAMDDLKPPQHQGADMMGTLEFTSACYYRYSLVSFKQLVSNLGGDRELANDILAAFIRASIAAIPSGKQHSTAACSPPSFIMATVRDWAASWSLVNAFEAPVWAANSDRCGLVRQSIKALDDYWGRLAEMYGEESVLARPACWLDEADVKVLNEQRVQRLSELINNVIETIAEHHLVTV